MDGFETVRQFRRIEKMRLDAEAAAMAEGYYSEISSVSNENSDEQRDDGTYVGFLKGRTSPVSHHSHGAAPAPTAGKDILEDTNDNVGEGRREDKDEDVEHPLADEEEEEEEMDKEKRAQLLQLVPEPIEREKGEKGNRSRRITPHIHTYRQLIIGMSSSVDEITRQKALDSGMDFFLPKPFSLEKFIETTRQSSSVLSQHGNSPKHRRDCMFPQQSNLSSTSVTSSLTQGTFAAPCLPGAGPALLMPPVVPVGALAPVSGSEHARQWFQR